MNKLQLKNAANRLRLDYGIGLNEPIRIKSWMLKLEVLVVFKPLSAEFSGMAIKQNKNRFMLVNSNHRMAKQHFTVAHELYHLFVQEDFHHEVSNVGKFDKSDINEYHADWFAAYLLMPDDGILSLIPEDEIRKDKINLATVVKIEQYYACSRTALLIRLEDMGLISKEKKEAFKTNVIKSAMELGYNTDLYHPANEDLIVGNYGTLAKELFDKEIISESHYLSLMLDLGIDIDLSEKYNVDE